MTIAKRGCRAVAVVVLAACLLGPTVPTAHGEEAAEEPRITNIFVETDLRDALQDVAAQADVTIIPDDSVAGVVTATLTDVPLSRALNIMLAGKGYVVHTTEDYVLICSPDPDAPAFAEISDARTRDLQYISPRSAVSLLPEMLSRYVRTAPDEQMVFLIGPPRMLDRIDRALDEIDRAGRHVVLEARIVALDRSGLLDMGVQWDWPEVVAGWHLVGSGETRPDYGWGIRIGYTPDRTFTNALSMTLNLLAENDEATVLARPTLMAQHGEEAEIRVSTEEYFEVTTGGIYERVDLEKIETGTVLTILPRINANGEITLKLGTEVSDVIARGEANLPVVTRRTANSTLRIKDGGTAVVAGLMDSRSREIRRRVPFLHYLPGIGYLFRHRSGREESRHYAVFVTATLVRDAEDPPDRPDPVRIDPVSEDEFRAELAEVLRRMNDEQPDG